ncbi:MAG: hypothetical protein CMF62_00740 [Magnetococcales bacterium]|nr:hypothetical protein [Magnetococcales bacterium]|tara:strand:+ start:38937 stop:40853 length:1917 start_codon:yes stop_codon:yes gene_type:complete
MIILIPLGGIGKRFSDKHYQKPKPLINAMGKPIIHWLLDNLNLSKVTTIVIPYNKIIKKFNFETSLRKHYPNINFLFITLDKNTEGAAHTIKIALDQLIKDNFKDQPILCADGDNFYTTDIITTWNGDNCVYSFKDEGNDPVFSYLKVQNNAITDIVEKEKISDYASTGAYGFSSYKQLLKYCNFVMDKKIKQKNEYYVSAVIKTMINDNHHFILKLVNRDNYICLGTPNQLRLFSNNFLRLNNIANNKLITKKRYCFDLDNTLVTYPKKINDYSTVEPIESMINFVKYLKSMGNTIIIYTARRMKTHNGNLGKVIADIAQITFETLDKFDIPYDEVVFGKPYADYYIDDLGVNAYSNLEKEFGFYKTQIQPRNFNEVNVVLKEMFIKKGHNLKGEIYYYRNIPPSIRDMFPNFFGANENETMYEIEKINGIEITTLHLSEELGIDILNKILNSLNRIHETIIDEKLEDIDIYQNYIPKLNSRYKNYDYSKYSKHYETYKKLKEELQEYQNKKQGQYSMIHGDPVFTNIFIDNRNNIKFIDMRGTQGDKCTLYGDKFYDYGKLYQSLLGYDEIHENKFITSETRNTLIEYFENYIINKFDKNTLKNIKLITNSLLFTLIPLHDNEKCERYYKLIDLKS